MALNFNYADVVDKDVVCTDPTDPDKYHPVFNAIVWLSLICGYSSITAANAEKVHARIAQYELVSGGMLAVLDDGRRRPLFITLDDVKRYIGLRTNAPTYREAQWAKMLAQMAYEKGVRQAAAQEQSAYEKLTQPAEAVL